MFSPLPLFFFGQDTPIQLGYSDSFPTLLPPIFFFFSYFLGFLSSLKRIRCTRRKSGLTFPPPPPPPPPLPSPPPPPPLLEQFLALPVKHLCRRLCCETGPSPPFSPLFSAFGRRTFSWEGGFLCFFGRCLFFFSSGLSIRFLVGSSDLSLPLSRFPWAFLWPAPRFAGQIGEFFLPFLFVFAPGLV